MVPGRATLLTFLADPSNPQCLAPPEENAVSLIPAPCVFRRLQVVRTKLRGLLFLNNWGFLVYLSGCSLYMPQQLTWDKL